MVPVSRAATVEAGETDVQPGIVVLDHVRCCTGGLDGKKHTMESKHWVQSSRYTAWDGPGILRAARCCLLALASSCQERDAPSESTWVQDAILT